MTEQTDPSRAMFVRYDNGDSKAAGFTALEDACIRLKVLHPDIPRWLYDLIVEARRMDAAMHAMEGLLAYPGNPDMTIGDLTERTEAFADFYIANIVKPDPEIK